MTESITKTALAILGGALFICLAGIIALAWADKSTPDVLVGTTGAVSASIVGLLVKGPSSIERPEASEPVDGDPSV